MKSLNAVGQGDDWIDFFEKHKDYTVAAGFYECRRDFSLEDLYQAFKQRMAHEAEQEQER